MNKAERSSIVWRALNECVDWSNQNLSLIRATAWNYYLNRPRGDELAGRSQVQDTTIRDFHGALMSTIMPSYATDHVVQFEPYGQGDEDQAEAESAAINSIFTEDNSGYLELANAISDCLLFRNGIIKVWVEDEKEEITRRFAAPAATVKAGLKQQGIDAEVTMDDGLAVATYTQEKQRLRIKAIEPSYFIIDPNQQDQEMQGSAIMGERIILTRQELRDMGVSRTDINSCPQLSDEGLISQVSNNADIRAKFVEGASSYYTGPTWADERVECYWIHMRMAAVRWRFLVSNQLILLEDKVSQFPYASGVAWPVPHRWSGLCLLDLLQNTQDSKTSILRQYLDNLNHANNHRYAYNPAETEQDDILNAAPGRGIRSMNPANIFPQPVMDISSNSLAGLAYFDDVAGKQAGAALDMASAEAQGVKDVSGLSVEMQLGPKEQMASYASRNIAETLVRQTFLLIHRTLREQWKGKITYRKAGNWQEVEPGSWAPRSRINVVVGLSPGDRRRRKANLQEVIQYQMGMIQGGTANITTTWKGVHAALTDWMKACELDGMEGYFLDPAGQESLQGQQAAQQQSQTEQQMQQQLMQVQLQMEQQKAQIDAQKLELDKYKHDTDLQFKYWEVNQNAEIEEAKLIEQGTQARLGRNGAAGPGGSAGKDADRDAD
jgi:hypothetical protein